MADNTLMLFVALGLVALFSLGKSIVNEMIGGLERGRKALVDTRDRRVHEYVESQQTQNVLLRASNTPDSPSDLLLRPAAGAGAEEEDELLRPVFHDIAVSQTETTALAQQEDALKRDTVRVTK